MRQLFVSLMPITVYIWTYICHFIFCLITTWLLFLINFLTKNMLRTPAMDRVDSDSKCWSHTIHGLLSPNTHSNGDHGFILRYGVYVLETERWNKHFCCCLLMCVGFEITFIEFFIMKRSKKRGRKQGKCCVAQPTMALPWEGQKRKLYMLKTKRVKQNRKRRTTILILRPSIFVVFYPSPLHHSSPLFSLPFS